MLKTRAPQAPAGQQPAAGGGAWQAQAGEMAEALGKSAVRAIGSQLGREIMRGVLGSIFGGTTTSKKKIVHRNRSISPREVTKCTERFLLGATARNRSVCSIRMERSKSGAFVSEICASRENFQLYRNSTKGADIDCKAASATEPSDSRKGGPLRTNPKSDLRNNFKSRKKKFPNNRGSGLRIL